MARSSNHAAARPAAAEAAAAPESAAAAADGADAAKAFITNSLAIACAVVGWLGQMQRLHAKGIADLAQTLETALREAERAADAQALLAVTSGLVNQQMTLVMRQIGAGIAQWVESDLQFAERMGTEVAALAQQTLPGSVQPTPASSNELAALKDYGRLQDQWLAITQRCLDAAGARPAH